MADHGVRTSNHTDQRCLGKARHAHHLHSQTLTFGDQRRFFLGRTATGLHERIGCVHQRVEGVVGPFDMGHCTDGDDVGSGRKDHLTSFGDLFRRGFCRPIAEVNGWQHMRALEWPTCCIPSRWMAVGGGGVRRQAVGALKQNLAPRRVAEDGALWTLEQ